MTVDPRGRISISVCTRDGIPTIQVAGRLTMGESVDIYRQTVSDVLIERHESILIDLSAVEYVDSSGIGALVQSLNNSSAQGVKLKLLNVPRRVRDLLKLTGIIHLFECIES